MASDFNADAMDECPELYGVLDGCLKYQSVGVEPDWFSTNFLKDIPIVSNEWKRSKSLYSETAERWNEEDVGYD